MSRSFSSIILGALFAFVGYIVLVASLSADSAGVGVFAGGLLLLIGGIAIQIGTIGLGVRMGLRDHDVDVLMAPALDDGLDDEAALCSDAGLMSKARPGVAWSAMTTLAVPFAPRSRPQLRMAIRCQAGKIGSSRRRSARALAGSSGPATPRPTSRATSRGRRD